MPALVKRVHVDEFKIVKEYLLIGLIAPVCGQDFIYFCLTSNLTPYRDIELDVVLLVLLAFILES